MAFDPDDEILQDFLLEAGEILDLLSEQLVELESKSEDKDLLNSIFRGFHTVKGGAGFLSLTNLVNVCHIAENVFDLLRQEKRHVDPDLMDVILKVLDTVNEMFEEIRNGHEPSEATPKLLQQLEALVVIESVSSIPVKPIELSQEREIKENLMVEISEEDDVNEKSATDNEITEEEFEKLLDSIENQKKQAVQVPESTATDKNLSNLDEITEEEFEVLLDELNSPSLGKKDELEFIQSDEITEEEFENLLDSLQRRTEKTNEKNKVKQERVSEKAEKTKPEGLPENLSRNEKALGKTTLVKDAASESTVRVDTKRLDEIMNMVGELVLIRNRLVTLRECSTDEELSKTVSNLDVVTGDLQMAVMKTRMQPIKKVFGRFSRVIRDLARSLKKEVNLEMKGEETDLDKNLVEALSDPLIHLVRNSVDHGIELPEERAAIGKPKAGLIKLSAEQAGDHIFLTISDDGKGMDADALRESAIRKGILDEEVASRLDNRDCFNLIFMPGFSTKEEISDISGRGVGMDVVKTKITELNGSIQIDSKQGKGTSIQIKVPLTLAILPTLMILIDGQTFALPLTNVNEIFHLDLKKTNIVDGQLVILVRGKAIPLFYLKDWLSPFKLKLSKSTTNEKVDSEGHVVIVTIGTQRVGFVVDGLLGQEEVVIKALGDMLQGTAGIAGATITGDGKIAMILDIPSLLNAYARKAS